MRIAERVNPRLPASADTGVSNEHTGGRDEIRSPHKSVACLRDRRMEQSHHPRWIAQSPPTMQPTRLPLHQSIPFHLRSKRERKQRTDNQNSTIKQFYCNKQFIERLSVTNKETINARLTITIQSGVSEVGIVRHNRSPNH